MGLFDNTKKKRYELGDRKKIFNDMLKSGGKSVALGHAKYLGGHPDILGEKEGDIIINSLGVFFRVARTYNYIFIPVENMLLSEFKTGEETSRNSIFSRLLALNGYTFAFRKKLRDKHIYLTINYLEKSIKNTVLFEANSANIFASAIAKVRKDYTKAHQKNGSSNDDVSVTKLIKQISELKALGILTENEYTEKKKELLSRI